MDESERRSSDEEKARREAANVARSDKAHEHAAPLWGFWFAPIGGAVAGIFMNLSKPDCYTGDTLLSSAPKTDLWCSMVTATGDAGDWMPTIVGVFVGAIAYGLVYVATYAYHYKSEGLSDSSRYQAVPRRVTRSAI